MCLLDWQMSRVSSPVIDLSYFFMTSTLADLREQHLNDFLKSYYDSLTKSIKLLGSDPDQLYPFEQFQQQLIKFGKYGLLLAPSILKIMCADPKNVRSLDEFSESFKATGNKDNTDVAAYNQEAILAYKERIGDLYRDTLSYGWI